MTSKHKKRTPLIRRLTSIVAVFAIFILSMPMAQAANATGNATVIVSRGSAGGSLSTNQGSASVSYSSTTQQTKDFGSAPGNYYYGINRINYGMTDIDSTVGIYISYYFYSHNYAFVGTNAVQPFTGQYTNHEGNTGTLSSVDIDAFDTGNSNNSKGVSLKAQFKGTPDLPISNLSLIGSTNVSYAPFRTSTSSSQPIRIIFTSNRVITTEYSAELDAMENMADNIAQQNQMMQAMYGEIIAVCNAIYQKCGDLETAINLTNSYCKAMLDALSDIASTTENIYTLLGTQFALLISTIQTESSNIQDAIASAEAKLEAYFDAVGSGAVGTLPEETEDIENKADGLIEDESAYESDASEQFADIVASFNGFSGGALNGVALATDLFTQIWNVLGEWKVVYTFPLIMGLVLLVIGRMSRFSGTMNSRNNGDKDVGGD